MSQKGARLMLEAMKKRIDTEVAAGNKPTEALGTYNASLRVYKARYGQTAVQPPATSVEAE